MTLQNKNIGDSITVDLVSYTVNKKEPLNINTPRLMFVAAISECGNFMLSEIY